MFDPKAAGEEADKMIQALNQPQDATGETQEAPKVEDQTAESTDAIVQDEPLSNDDQGVPTTSDNTRNDDTSQKLEALAKQAEAAEQRWKVLQGMIDKKDGEIETLRALLAQISSNPQTTAEDKPQNLLTSNDVDSFGDDLIDLVKRGSLSVLQSELPKFFNDINARLAKLEGSVQGVEQVTAKNAQDMFFEALQSKVPDWQTLNTDQGFLGWLNEEDQFTGASRIELLQHAFGKQDVNRTATFFLEYKRLFAAPEASEPKENKVAKLVSPGKTKAASARVDTGSKRTWTRAEIGKLYSDKREGRISAKQFEEFERDIFAAQADGRIAA